jgi:DNA-binding NarL/FixJ family response regulator
LLKPICWFQRAYQQVAGELLKAIEHVLQGKPYSTPKLRAEDWIAPWTRTPLLSKDLTPRQKHIVRLCGEGRSLKEIASFLDLSEKTVEFHKHRFQELFNLRSNADVVLFAVKRGLISINPKRPRHNNTH